MNEWRFFMVTPANTGIPILTLSAIEDEQQPTNSQDCPPTRPNSPNGENSDSSFLSLDVSIEAAALKILNRKPTE
jgi:hypothetical protein